MKRKKSKTKKVKEIDFTVINDYDGNDTFTVKAANSEEATRKALMELGWWVADN